MAHAQTLLGLHRADLGQGETSEDTSIYFYSPRPNIYSPGYNTLTRDANFNWVGQGRLNRDQAYQWTGSGEETVMLEGRLYPHLFGGLDMLEKLRQAGKGKRWMLTRYYVQTKLDEGGGEIADSYEYGLDSVGSFGVRRVRQGNVRIGNSGLPDIVEFVLELIKLGEDKSDGTSQDFLFAARPSENNE